MLRKPAIVTVIPGSPGREYREASSTCTPIMLGGVGGETPPGVGTGSSVFVPADGTPIILEQQDGHGGYNTYTGVAPAPAGYVCRLETHLVTEAGSTSPSKFYYVVCTN